jgi:arylsulfatase A-like enzyme
MPELERWTEKALVARRAVSPAGWTAPAHASIFSGRTVSQHGIHYGAGSIFRTRAFEGIRWLPERLTERGYTCIAVTANPLALPAEVTGFARVFSPSHRDWNRTVGAFADRNLRFTVRTSERLRWRMPYVDAEGMVDIARKAVPPEAGPVFLFVNFMDAHSPYNPPDQALELLGIRSKQLFGRYVDHREITRRWEDMPAGKAEELVALYDGELRWLDLHLKRLLDWIERRFGAESIVIVTADHGEELGEEGRVGHEYGLSQSLVHVPLFVRSPELAAGEFNALVDLRNLYQFISAAAEGRRPGTGELAPVGEQEVISERYPSRAHAATLGQEYYRPWLSLIQGAHKAVGPSEYDLQLFSLESSGFSRETRVWDESSARVLRRRMDRYWKRFRDRRDPGGHTLSLEEREQLQSLGYVN